MNSRRILEFGGDSIAHETWQIGLLSLQDQKLISRKLLAVQRRNSVADGHINLKPGEKFIVLTYFQDG